MEESTDVPMETDVSSTTEDVPETQEVTGSHGNVEMTIVVEKVDEEINSRSTENEMSKDDLSSSDVSGSTMSSPQKDVPKDKPNVKSLLKVSDASQSSIKPSSSLAELSKQNEPQSSMETMQTGVPDSSSKDSLSSDEEIENNSVNEARNHAEKCPDQVLQGNDVAIENTTPLKKIQTEVVSPQKLQILKTNEVEAIPKSPMKSSEKVQEKTNSLLKPENDVSKSKVVSNAPIKAQSPDLIMLKSLPKSPIKIVIANNKNNPISTSKNELLLDSSRRKGIHISPLKVQSRDSIKVKPIIVSPIKGMQSLDAVKINSLQSDSTNKTSTDSSEYKPDQGKVKPTQSLDSSPTTPVKSSEALSENSTNKQVDSTPQNTQADESIEASGPKKETPIKNSIASKSEPEPTTTNGPTADAKPDEKSVKDEKASVETKVDDTPCSEETKMDVDTTVDKEATNDSQTESNTDALEKEHNKSISRELKSLIKSAKESKIINECTQLTSKMRKSRSALDSSNTSLNTSVDADKIQGARRNSSNSQKSSCSEKSEKVALKRSMRSQNPEFVSKVKQFLNSVTGKGQRDTDEEDSEVEDTLSVEKHKKEDILSASSPKLKKSGAPPIDKRQENGKLRSDPYCWRCHWTVEQAPNEKNVPMSCTVCPRSFHYKCLNSIERGKINLEKNWVCPECMLILQAESSDSRSPAMKKISLGMLCDLLKHALDRMMALNGVEPFMQPVDRTLFPDYDKYVVHPMDLTLMKGNIAAGQYGSTEAFISDTQWILHNSIIFNTLQSKLTAAARALVRSCRAEMGEIEACHECYAAANARRPTWFTDVCTTPHILLWAKLKGFPYWPAKGMSVSSTGHVDVRFFGAHDRAWVPAKDCFLYSEKDPNNFRTKRQDILDSMQEAEQHIRNISRKYGKFVYPPFKTQLEPAKLGEQLKMMIPSFEGEVRTLVKDKVSGSPAAPKEKRSSISKSSKGSVHDGYVSESDDVPPPKTRKMADGAVIAQDKETASEKENSTKDAETPKSKGKESSRKRRRSELEEAVITIIEPTENSSTEKKKRLDDDKKEDKKSETQKSSTKENDEKNKAKEKPKDKEMTDTEKKTEDPTTAKDSVPSSAAEKENRRTTPRVTPIRIAFISKDKKSKSSLTKETTAKIVTPNKAKTDSPSTPTTKAVAKDTSTPTSSKDATKATDKEKTPQRKSTKPDKTPDSQLRSALLKNEKTKAEKRRNSRNKSANGSAQKADKKEKQTETSKEKPKEATGKTNDVTTAKAVGAKQTVVTVDNGVNSKPVRERLQFDDDMSLAVIARSGKSVQEVISPMPTISNVISLSTVGQNKTPTTNTASTSKTIEITVEANSDSSIFTPTSTNNVKTMTDAATQLQKLRKETEPLVGRVGVRAFARMTSPDKEQNKKDNVEVEIKAEPIDLDDADRQMEKLDLMNSFRLRPVNPASLRDVRINKVVVTPLPASNPTKAAEVRPRAKKTFPQPKKDDGRSELNGKNSMVYIPIQPSATQCPLRTVRTGTPTIRMSAPVTTATNSLLTSMQPPIMQVSATTTSSPASTSQTTTTAQSIPIVGQVPTSVHTVPLMTSVNGQWMFSFQPVMSVGAIDSPSTPVLNGLPDRVVPPLISLPMVSTGASPVQTTVVQSVPPTLQSTTVNKSIEITQPGEPPRLQQRPPLLLLNPLDPNMPSNSVPTPSIAGPVTAKLNQNATKLTDFFRTLLLDSLDTLNDPASQAVTLTLRLEHETWKNKQAIQELKHNHDLTIAEMRASFEKEKARITSELQKNAQTELEEAVKQAKSKQWCANCCQEAQFYCCWNTSYCDYPCQRAHWAQHFSVCSQQRGQSSLNENGEPPNSPEHRLQAQPDTLPKNAPAPAPALVAATKMASRNATEQSNAQQNGSIIVSTVQDANGAQSVKCVGTYKPPTPAAPIIINKQILNEDSSKKMVSSGGYLIVGAGNNSAVVTPGRPTPTIQYYS